MALARALAPRPQAHSRRRADRQSRRQNRTTGGRSAVRLAEAARSHPRARDARREARRSNASAPSAWPTAASSPTRRSRRHEHARQPARPPILQLPMARPGISLGRVFVLALRELRSGLNGFTSSSPASRSACAVITAVGALSDALRRRLREPGPDYPGRRRHVRAHACARHAPKNGAGSTAQGQVSESATLRTMGRTLDGEEQALIEIKAVDGALSAGGRGADQRRRASPTPSPTAPPWTRCCSSGSGSRSATRCAIGEASVPVRATIGDEPDAIADRLTYGPRVFISLADPRQDRASCSRARWCAGATRWRFPTQAALGRCAAGRCATAPRRRCPTPASRWRTGAIPRRQVTRTLDRLRQFLTFLGLTALLVGGVGVAQRGCDVHRAAARRHRDHEEPRRHGQPRVLDVPRAGAGDRAHRRRDRTRGGPGRSRRCSSGCSAMCCRSRPRFPSRCAACCPASLYGVLVALLFTLWPLGRAELVSASVLFRDEVAPQRIWPRPRVIVMTVLAGAALLGFAVLMSDQRQAGALFLRRPAAGVRRVHRRSGRS